MQSEIRPKSSDYHLRFLLLGVFLFVALAGTSQINSSRFEILKKITEYYNMGDFPNAYKTAKTLADFHLQRNELHYYINYSNKANNYFSEFNQDSAIISQFDLLKFMVLNSDTIKQEYFKIAFSDFISLIEKPKIVFNGQKELKELLSSIENDPLLPDYSKRKNWVEKNIGKCQEYNQNYQDAIKFYLQAFRSSNKKDFESFERIGKALFSLDEFGPAIDVFLICLKESEEVREKAILTNNLGNSFFQMKEYSTALLFFRVSLYYRNLLPDEKGSLLPIIYQNIGNTHHLSGDADEAYISYSHSLKICMEFQPGNKEMVGNIYNNLGNYFFDHGSSDSAVYYYEQGLKTRKQLQKELNFYQLQSYYNLANSYLKKSEIGKVIAYTDSAFAQIQIIKSQGQRTRGIYSEMNLENDLYFLYHLKAQTYLELYKATDNQDYLDTCSLYYKKSIEILNTTLGNIYDEESKLRSVKDLKQTLMDYIDVQFRIDSLNGTRNPEIIYHLIENCHNNQLLDLINKKKKYNQVLKAQLYNKVLVNLVSDSIVRKVYSHNYDWEKVLDQFLQKTTKEFDINQFIESASVIEESDIPITFKIDYQDLNWLKPNELMIEFVIDQKNNRVIYFSRLNNTSNYGILAGSVNLSKQVKKMIKAINRYDNVSIYEHLAYFHSFFHEILQFNRPEIRDVIILPDGYIWDIPFDAIPVDQLDQNSFLIVERNLGLHISSTFLFSKRKSKVPLSFSNWVGFAPIIFDSDQAFKLPPLLHSRDEISTIKKSLNGDIHEALSYTYDDASLNNLQLHRKSSFLHLSTHSQFNSDTDQIGLCFIDNGQIRILDYNQIIELNLQPENVYLNVCSSSTSKFYDGEGPINLNRAFILNGANNIVFTTRRVIDTFAMEFAIAFYQNLSECQNFSISLANTKREMIKSDKYNSPIYWSNYQLIYTN